MLKTHKEIQPKEVEVIDEIICNTCGEAINTEWEAEGMIETECSFGYDSKYFGDGAEIKFTICEKCLFEIVAKMKHDPRVRGAWWEE